METTRKACHTTADYFTSIGSETFNPELMKLCAEGLRELGDNIEEYSSKATISSCFFQELCEKVKSISDDTAPKTELQHDNAFALFEALAVVFRETFLRAGASALKPIQQAILDFFEGSGHWKANEGTLVSDYYYNRIPISIMQGLQRQSVA